LKILKNIQQKLRDTLAWGIALPFVVLLYGSVLALFALPIVTLIWLVKHIF
jgi:hypothetical protein